jgi:hypothetical protein
MAAEQPKKPIYGAYGRFLSEKRKEFMNECAGKITEVAKLAGVRFKAISESERAGYQTKYEQAKAKYDKDMEAFTAAGGVKKDRKMKGVKKDRKRKGVKKDRKRKGKAGKAGKKSQKDPQAPKRPTGGGFGCFLAENRPAFAKACEGKSVTAVWKMASNKWKALNQTQKKPFEIEYAQKKAAYEEAMKSYVPLPSADGKDDDEPPAKKARMSKEQREAAKETNTEKKEVKAKVAPKAKAEAKVASKAKAMGKFATKAMNAKLAPKAEAKLAPKAKAKAKVAAKVEKKEVKAYVAPTAKAEAKLARKAKAKAKAKVAAKVEKKEVKAKVAPKAKAKVAPKAKAKGKVAPKAKAMEKFAAKAMNASR